MKNRVKKSGLERLYELKAQEQIRLEIISSYAVYFVPLIPAFLSFFDIVGFITWSEKIPRAMIVLFGIIAGGILEFMGLAASHTFSAFQVHNREAGKTQKVSVFWVIVAWVFYLVVMFALNVLLPWEHISEGERIARSGLALLSIPVFILVSVRSIHANILLKKQKEKEERRENKERKKAQKTQVVTASTNGHDKDGSTLVKEYLEKNSLSPHDFGRNGYSIKELADLLQLKDNNVRQIIFRMRKEEANEV